MAARSGTEELQVKEQQLEAWEEKLSQRALALAESSKVVTQRRAALAQLLQQAQRMGTAPPPGAQALLGGELPAGGPAVREAQAAADQARKAAVEARTRAAQAWEEDLGRQQAALGQLQLKVGEATVATQQAIEAQAAAQQARAAQAAQAASPFAPVPNPEPMALGAPKATPAPLGQPRPPPPPRRPPSEPRLTDHNQRVHSRARLKVQVDFESDHNFFTGFSSDISEGGLFIATHNIQPLGSAVEVAFALPSGEQVMAKGLVKWVREPSPEVQAQPGMGIQFESLPDDAREAVHRFIEQREPIFYDE